MRLAVVSDRVGVIVMTVFFIVLITLSITFRSTARNLTHAGFGTDDWLAVAAFFFTLCLNGVFLAGTIEGAITGHSIVVNNLPVTNDLEILTQKYKYAYQTLEKVVFGLIKLSILFLWKRIFASNKRFIIICYVMMAIVMAWMVAFFFETIFQCGTNWSLNWAPIFVFLAQCTASLDVLTIFGVTDVVTDMIIMIMPVPLIWSLQLPKRKKVALVGIFALGFFTIGAGVARLFYYLATSYNQQDMPDFIADATLTLVWSTIEVNIAMMVCSLPILSPIFARFRDNIVSLSRRSGISKWIEITNERSTQKNSYQLSDLSQVENGGSPNTTPFSSQHETTCSHVHRTVATSTSLGTRGAPNHKSGILARTEISSTVENSKSHAL